MIDFLLLVRRRREHVRHVGPVIHLLDARRQHEVAHPRGDLQERGPEGDAARGARGLHPGGGHTGHAQRVGHERAHVLLSHELPPGHVADVDAVQVIHARLPERRERRFDEQVAQARLPQLTERRHPRRDDCHIAHGASSE